MLAFGERLGERGGDHLTVKHGFSITDTGGGVEQLLRSRNGGESWVIITSADGEIPTSLSAPCMVGRYTADSETHVPAPDFVAAVVYADVLDV